MRAKSIKASEAMMTVQEENGLSLSESLLRAAAETDDEIAASFFEWVAGKYNSREYADTRAQLEGKSSPKFFAICERTRRLMPIAKWLSWHTKSDLKTLDLGSGAGHMGLLANFFGHSSLGIDDSRRLDRLREFWRQPVIIHRIEARMPLPPIGKFHSITSILTNFGRAWKVDEWSDFLNRVLDDHLEPDGEFALHFPGDQSLECRIHMRQQASRFEDDGRIMFFVRN